tara:strand:- start:4534 stop:5145 length:612 start_codon:yes stop_codon:yes gene_type:complete
MEKVIIVGKGPSLCKIPKMEGYKVAALNETVNFCEKVDFCFVGDTELLDLIDHENFDRVSRFVIPAHPHVNKKVKDGYTYEDWVPKLHGRPYDLVEYHTTYIPYPNRVIPNIPKQHISSIAESAVLWCLMKGYREFYTIGMDPSGGYHPEMLKSPHHKAHTGINSASQHQTKVYNDCTNLIKKEGGTIKRLEQSFFDSFRDVK